MSKQSEVGTGRVIVSKANHFLREGEVVEVVGVNKHIGDFLIVKKADGKVGPIRTYDVEPFEPVREKIREIPKAPHNFVVTKDGDTLMGEAADGALALTMCRGLEHRNFLAEGINFLRIASVIIGGLGYEFEGAHKLVNVKIEEAISELRERERVEQLHKDAYALYKAAEGDAAREWDDLFIAVQERWIRVAEAAYELGNDDA